MPQTGASKMAAAAKRGATGSDGIPRARRGSQAVPIEEDDHPLSEKSLHARSVLMPYTNACTGKMLTSRDYLTLHTLSHLFHLPSRWKLIRPLGQGAYGLVISVQDTLSGEPVAVKCITRVFDKVILARRALREITLLRHFGEHDNLTGYVFPWT
jgi:serine/threonine protein kinase